MKANYYRSYLDELESKSVKYTIIKSNKLINYLDIIKWRLISQRIKLTKPGKRWVMINKYIILSNLHRQIYFKKIKGWERSNCPEIWNI